MKLRIKSMILEHKEAKNNQSQKEEEKRIQKSEDSVSSLWDTFKKYNICILEVPKGEEKARNWTIRKDKDNFPSLVKVTDVEVQKAPSPNFDGCKEARSKTHHN